MTITQSGYVKQGDRSGAGYRLRSAEVVRVGRRREFHQTIAVTLLLLVVQQPMIATATGEWATAYDFPPEVPGRLSLIVDLFLVVAYLYVAYRAWGLVRSHRAGLAVRRLARAALALVTVGAALDLLENYRLWERFGEASGDTVSYAVTFEDALGFALPLAGDLSLSWTKLALVVVGLVVAVVLASVGGPREPSLAERMPLGTPGDHEDVVICCSGGGIRSAAFSLGGLQELARHGIYDDAAAVVGVSGGGYTAAAMHVLRWGPADEPRDAPDEWMSMPPDAAAFALASPETQWLRRHTRYVLDSVRVAAQAALSLFFGIAVNLLLVTVLLGGTAWVLAWVFLASGRLQPWPDLDEMSGAALDDAVVAGIHGSYGADWTPVEMVWVVPVLGAALFLAEHVWDRFATPDLRWRTALRQWSLRLVAWGAAACVLLLGVPWVLEELADYAMSSGSTTAQLLHQIGLVPTRVCNAVLATGDSACGVDGTSTAATSVTTVGTVSIATVVSAILAVLASAKGAAGGTADSGKGGIGGLLSKVWAKVKDPIVPWAAVVVIVVIAVTILLRWVAALVETPDLVADWQLAAVFGVLLLLVKVVTEPNRTSMHHFFRERISTAFFVRREGDTVGAVPYHRPLRFSQAAPPGVGPRLVTCAVANVSDQELVPSRRGCTPFVFDHDRVGLTDRLLPEGAALRPTGLYEFAADHNYRDATIPAAVAISAAAFSPLAGRENIRLGPYRAVLALGNARLGVWLPNPIWVDEAGLVRRLLRLGRLDEAAEVYLGLPPEERDYLDLPAAERQLLSRGSHWLNVRAALHRVAIAEHTGVGARDAIDLAADVLAAATGRPPPDLPDLATAKAELRRRLEALEQRPGGRRFWQAVELLRNIVKKPGLSRLGREAVGRTSVYDRFLYVTDGGHYDNLGLIEALRRRPREVFVLDASNDPEDSFRTLGKAVATARMDLDCEVDLDPKGMRRLADKRAPAAWCTGSYRFPNGDRGNIYLVKAIMLDGPTWDVETYAADNPEFPRTGTGNQLYSEFDFEAYRALGQYAAARLLASEDYHDALRRLGIVDRT